MRTLVIGLDCATPDILLRDPRLTHLRALMARGCYGVLESVIPPITVPAWMCMATSRDPGSLGVYGFRNRASYSYDKLEIVTSRSIQATPVWDCFGVNGKQVVVVGVPPSYPPPPVRGISVGCFLTPDAVHRDFTYPAGVSRTIRDLVGEYPVDVQGFRTSDKMSLRDQIYAMTRTHFEVVRHLMRTVDWEYFQFVEIGLDRMQHGFWKYHDSRHRQYVAGHPWEGTVSDYYAYLDEEIGAVLQLVDDDDIVLVVSDHGAQRLDGGFCVNEWLVRQGLLSLKARPAMPTPLQLENVDWSHTRVWSEGGYYARVFVNLAGRESSGIVSPAEYEDFVENLRRRFEALEDDRGAPMRTRAFRPREIYRQVTNIAPDLIVHFGELSWRSIGGVGYDELHVQENDTGPDDCNHAQYGAFILRAPRLDIRHEVEGMHLLDIAPTLLDLAQRAVPSAMQGRSLVSRT